MTSAPGRWTRRALLAYEPIVMVLGPGLFVCSCLIWFPFAILLRWLLPRPRAAALGRRGISRGARLYLRLLELLCACRFDLAALDALESERALILVANHPSLIDFLLLVSRLPNAVCVMKAGLMDNLLFGPAARLARYLPNQGPLELVLGACEELSHGAHLIIFPEGTRTRAFPLDPCGELAAVIADRAGVAVQTLVIGFSSPYLGKNWPLWRKPRLPLEFRTRLGPRLAPSHDSAALTRAIEGALRSGIAESFTEARRGPDPASPGRWVEPQ